MKRYSLLLVVSALLVLMSAGATLAVFPAEPDGRVTLSLQQGWLECHPAWFICTDTNDIRTACSQFVRPGQTLNLAPKLSSLLQRSTKDLFIVTNPPCTQGPVFCLPELMDGHFDGYTGKWRVIYITFKPGVKPWNVCSCRPVSPENPGGIPHPNEAVFTKTNIVVDYALIAVGPISGPGPINNGNPNRFIFRLPEVISINPAAKTVTLPFFKAFCADPLTKRCMIAQVIITAADEKRTADELGLIFAPRLHGVDKKNIMKTWVFSDEDEQPTQFPVLQACPIPLGCRNTNFEYSPVIEAIEIERERVPICSIFCNPDLIMDLLRRGKMHEGNNKVRFEASVVGYL